MDLFSVFSRLGISRGTGGAISVMNNQKVASSIGFHDM